MISKMERILLEKIITSILSTALFSLALGFIIIFNNHTDFSYNTGNQIIGSAFVAAIYAGPIIFTYGNLASLGIDYFKNKLTFSNGLSILLHTFFGLVGGLFFMEWGFALYGAIAACLYALINQLIKRKINQHKLLLRLLTATVFLYLLSWGIFEAISPPLPPFTLEDAVEFATSGEGTVTDDFPEKIGSWQEEISGYNVEKELKAEEIGKEKYIVHFIERWEKGKEQGYWRLSYEVDRDAMTLSEHKGENPPYWE